MAFSKKRITLIFQLGTGQFGETGLNQVTVTGLRISAAILKPGGAAQSMCQLRVFGLPPSIYNQLTSIYSQSTFMQRNTVIVMAGDTDPLPTVFIGQITLAQIDLNSQPDSVLNIIAQTALLQDVQVGQPLSFPNGINVAEALSSLATTMKMDFENNGVTAVLPKSYISGSPKYQAEKIVTDAGIKWNGGDNNVLAIWPANGSRTTRPIPLISYKDNLVGYPSYSNIGIGIRCLYNPNLLVGAQAQIESSLNILGLNGLWTVYGLTHTLESELPEGQWVSEFQGANYAVINMGGGA